MNINVIIPRTTRIYTVKANGADWEQCPITEFTHWGLLRFIPPEAGSYEGSVFARTGENLIKYQEHQIEFNSEGITAVDIFIRKHDTTDTWVQVGKSIAVTGAPGEIVTFLILQEDIDTYAWDEGTVMDVRVKDSNTEVEETIITVIDGSIVITQPDYLEIGTDVEFEVNAETDIPSGDLYIDVYNVTLDTWVSYGAVAIQSNGGYFINDNITLSSSDFNNADEIQIFVSRKDSEGNMMLSDYVELTVVEKALSLDDSVEPFVTGTQTLDEDFAVIGDSDGLIGQDITIQAKKSTQVWADMVELGHATIQADGTWSKSDCQLSSSDFAVSDSIDIRAVYGTVTSNEGNLTVVGGEVEFPLMTMDSSYNVYLVRDCSELAEATPAFTGSSTTGVGWDYVWSGEKLFRMTAVSGTTLTIQEVDTSGNVLNTQDVTLPRSIGDTDSALFLWKDGKIFIYDAVNGEAFAYITVVNESLQVIDTITLTAPSGHAMVEADALNPFWDINNIGMVAVVKRQSDYKLGAVIFNPDGSYATILNATNSTTYDTFKTTSANKTHVRCFENVFSVGVAGVSNNGFNFQMDGTYISTFYSAGTRWGFQGRGLVYSRTTADNVSVMSMSGQTESTTSNRGRLGAYYVSEDTTFI